MSRKNATPCEDYPTDELLLAALKRRIERAMECLYSRNQPKLMASLTRLGSTWKDAEDGFHDGLIAFLGDTDRLYLGAALDTILYRYVYNKWIDLYRNKSKEMNVPGRLPEPEPEPANPYLDPDMQEELEKAITKLEPESQRLMYLLLVEQKSAQEVATELNMKIDSVYNQKSRCIKYLRKQLNP